MKRDDSDLDPELQALITPRKIERQVPLELRARVLARARATMAGDVIPPAQPSQARPAIGARRRRLLPIALAASFALAGAAVGAVAALHGRRAPAPNVPPNQGPAPAAPAVKVGRPASDTPPVDAPDTTRPPHAAHPGPKGDPFTAELDLVQRAHAAFTRREFSAALALVAEHAHRFPKGHLAEQREALRVRSLIGAGRTDEARRAAAAFATRFPRSVLLPTVTEGSGSSER